MTQMKHAVQLVVVCVLMGALTLVGCAYAANTKALSKEEAKAALLELVPKELAGDVEVISVDKAPVEGLTEVVVSLKGKRTIVYLDATKTYMVQGSIINVKTKTDLTKEKYDDVNRVDVSKLTLKDSVLAGDPNAKHKVFVFTDPDCPYCVKFHEEMKKVVEKRKDIVFVIKLYPLPMHPQAADKSKAIMCEKSNDKALKLLEDAYAKKEIPKATCETKAVDDTLALGNSIGVQGTPTVFFSDGRMKNGLRAEDVMEIVDKMEKK